MPSMMAIESPIKAELYPLSHKDPVEHLSLHKLGSSQQNIECTKP